MTDPQFAPLPVRARGALEIFDTGLKILRRYFGVLLAWSALSALPWLVPFVGWALYFFTLPLIFGAVSCVMAAAVRGQSVGFAQIWNFTKPRYGALLGVLFLSLILLFALSFGTGIASSMILGFGVLLLDNLPDLLQNIVGGVGYIALLVVSSLLSCVAFGWFTMGGIISCLEDNHRGTSALGRASSLMAGNWKRVIGVCSVLTIIITIISTLFFGLFIYFIAVWFQGMLRGSGYDFWLVMRSAVYPFFILTGVILTFWMPPQLLIIAVLYLDLRVKKEALDLEWTNYATAPTPQIAPGESNFAPQSQIAPDAISTSVFSAGTSVSTPISLEKPTPNDEFQLDNSSFAPPQTPNSPDAPQNPA